MPSLVCGEIGQCIICKQTFKWYQLKVEAKESRFKFYLDDELMIDYKNKTAHPTGMSSLGAAVHTTTAHFDDFVATGDDIPDLTYRYLLNPS